MQFGLNVKSFLGVEIFEKIYKRYSDYITIFQPAGFCPSIVFQTSLPSTSTNLLGSICPLGLTTSEKTT